ncbi:MAG: UvrD-helicase domain-containing protein [Legionellaceae bacterium]|nr:UvrD-helicase domain-containing protein [Legionellaceae bacterium]
MSSDSDIRQQALDIQHSFIVQAPAGSGKTELLTQRYLKLLATVNEPEQIIAITFTRKAAQEMRDRILSNLESAQKQEPPTSEHQAQTFQYAKAALQQDTQQQWNLCLFPSRLRIMTIDALWQMLAKHASLAEAPLAHMPITDVPKRLYREAARQTLHYALRDSTLQTAMQNLLLHLDNDADKLIEWWSEVLGRRDQWLVSFYHAQNQSKEHYETALQILSEQNIQRFLNTVPIEYKARLHSLVQTLATIDDRVPSPSKTLMFWEDYSHLDIPQAKALAQMLLTKQGEARKSADHHIGFRATNLPKDQYKTLKTESQQVFASLDAPCVRALRILHDLPDPEYNLSQWGLLQNLFQLLPVLAAHLQMIFYEAQAIDFPGMALNALHALGEDDTPSDLALVLDYNLQHLLVDEFQDTSIVQFELFRKLVQGFEPNDGRTLFLVGDPMQSIYRFRQAEVGLFLQAQQHGLASIPLIPLTLTANFRSSPRLVQWINFHCHSIFPEKADLSLGAVCFQKAIPQKNNEGDIRLQAYADKKQEALGLAEEIRQLLQEHPQESIAILARSRSHLRYIVQVLREKNIAFQGVDLFPLIDLAHIQDIWWLTQCLLKPDYRLAWLSVLRSPYVGIALQDLEIFAQYHVKRNLSQIVQELLPPMLSEDAQNRLAYALQVLAQALEQQHTLPLITWIYQTHQQLHGNLRLSTEEQQDIEQFLNLLESHCTQNQLQDEAGFLQHLQSLYTRAHANSQVHLMTIHKSKGLEFDTVFLVGCGRSIQGSDKPLMRWLSLPHEPPLWLISPITSGEEEQTPQIYDYLGKIEEEKEYFEQQRVLYVAITRAKSRLYLSDNKEEQALAFRQFLPEFSVVPTHENSESASTPLPVLYRLPLEPYLTLPAKPAPGELVSFTHTTQPALIGTLLHELLQWLCQHPEQKQEIPWHWIGQKLKKAGLPYDNIQEYLHIMEHQLQRFLGDPIGQWIIASHTDAVNEFEISILQQHKTKTRIIDRMFVDQSIRWIIDFKTGNDSPEEEQHHRQQVIDYAHWVSQFTPEPIHLGIYYLAHQRWINFPFQEKTAIFLDNFVE